MNDVEKLMRMKKELERKATETAQMRGRVDELVSRMNADHDCSTLKQADTKLKKYATAMREKEIKLRDGVKKLESEYPWEQV